MMLFQRFHLFIQWKPDKRFEQLFESSREQFLDPSDVEAGVELLEDQWLSPNELELRLKQRREQDAAKIPVISTPNPEATAPVAASHPRADLPQDRPEPPLPSTPKSLPPFDSVVTSHHHLV